MLTKPTNRHPGSNPGIWIIHFAGDYGGTLLTHHPSIMDKFEAEIPHRVDNGYKAYETSNYHKANQLALQQERS